MEKKSLGFNWCGSSWLSNKRGPQEGSSMVPMVMLRPEPRALVFRHQQEQKMKEEPAASKGKEIDKLSFKMLRYNTRFSMIDVPEKIECRVNEVELNDILEEELRIRRKLSDYYNALGLPQAAAENSASQLAREAAMERCKMAWSKIPPFREAKRLAKKNGERLGVREHYESYWKPYVEAGYLFTFILADYDETIVKDLREYCRRNRLDQREAGLYIPTKKDYTDFLVANIGSVSGHDAQRALNAVATRVSSGAGGVELGRRSPG